jgi:hypothetical protein
MLSPEDRQAIEGLFERLAEVERRSGPRDAEAEALIRELMTRQPGAAYYLAQTVLVQETALADARERIADLERAADVTRDRPGPWDRDAAPPARQGGGFLAGAAQTALGVTGGLLLGSAIASLFTGSAQAEEEVTPEPAPEDDGGWDSGGDDWGDGGGDFDLGGGF